MHPATVLLVEALGHRDRLRAEIRGHIRRDRRCRGRPVREEMLPVPESDDTAFVSHLDEAVDELLTVVGAFERLHVVGVGETVHRLDVDDEFLGSGRRTYECVRAVGHPEESSRHRLGQGRNPFVQSAVADPQQIPEDLFAAGETRTTGGSRGVRPDNR